MTLQQLAIAEQEAVLFSQEGATPLRAWRKRQTVDDPTGNCRRTMRLIDVERLYGIPRTTWSQWEKPPGSPGSRRPDDENMHRLFEITGGAITPEDFYPVAEWRAELEPGGGRHPHQPADAGG